MARKRKWLPVEIDSVLDQRLQNWGDWRRREEAPVRTRCRSIEGRYRPPREAGSDVESETRSAWRPEIDEADGSFLDRVMRSPWFPQAEYAFLRAHYVLRAPPALILRTIGARRGDYRLLHARAVVIIGNRLTVVESRRYSAAHNSMAASSLRPESDDGGRRAGPASQTAEALAA